MSDRSIDECRVLVWGTCSNHVEGSDRGMVAQLLHVHDCPVRKLCLPRLSKYGVKGLAPRLEDMLQPSHKPTCTSSCNCLLLSEQQQCNVLTELALTR